jgi:hypothetical protein
MTQSLYPVVAFDLIDNEQADAALQEWGHWLGGCNRPFGRQSWGLLLAGELVAVAVSASTVNAKCGGYGRQEVVELARLCAHPEHRDLTRVALRLWRKVAEVKGGSAGQTWERPRKQAYEAKSVWALELKEVGPGGVTGPESIKPL